MTKRLGLFAIRLLFRIKATRRVSDSGLAQIGKGLSRTVEQQKSLLTHNNSIVVRFVCILRNEENFLCKLRYLALSV